MPEAEGPRPPLPREVDWSVLSNKLIEMEKQGTALITTLLPQLPPLTESEKAEQSSPVIWREPPLKKQPASQVTWAQVGHQLIELEKQREHMTILFIDQGNNETSQP